MYEYTNSGTLFNHNSGGFIFFGGWRKGGGYKKYSVYQLKPLSIIFVDSIHIKKLEYNFDDKYIDLLLIHDGVDILLTEMCVFIPQSLNTCVCIPKALYMCVAIPKDLDMCMYSADLDTRVCISKPGIRIVVSPNPCLCSCTCIHQAFNMFQFVFQSLGYVCLYPSSLGYVCLYPAILEFVCFYSQLLRYECLYPTAIGTYNSSPKPSTYVFYPQTVDMCVFVSMARALGTCVYIPKHLICVFVSLTLVYLLISSKHRIRVLVSTKPWICLFVSPKPLIFVFVFSSLGYMCLYPPKPLICVFVSTKPCIYLLSPCEFVFPNRWVCVLVYPKPCICVFVLQSLGYVCL